MSEENKEVKETPKLTRKKDKTVTIIVNGKEKKISQQSQYILDMLTFDD
jgi:hypothetical protein